MVNQALFVFDTSVTMSWCFEDEVSDYSERILDALLENSAVVPGLWSLEVANVLLVCERRGRISQDESRHFMGLLGELPIVLKDMASVGDWRKLLKWGGSVLFRPMTRVICSLQKMALPLATQDKGLIQAAHEYGILIYEPK